MYIDPHVKACIKEYFAELHSGEMSYPLKLQNELPPLPAFSLFAAFDWIKEHADELGIIVDSEGFYIKKQLKEKVLQTGNRSQWDFAE